jgi:hypothetical protein
MPWFELFVGLTIAIIGIRAIVRQRFSLSDAAPKITLTGGRARFFGMICIVSASLTLISWLYLFLNNQFQAETTRLTVLCGVTVVTAGIGFLITWFFEFLLGPIDDISAYDRALARKRKLDIASNFSDSDDLSDEELLIPGVVIHLGDDGELIYEEDPSESVTRDQSIDHLP